MIRLKLIHILIMLLWLSGCVGVIESGSPSNSSSTQAQSKAKFDGIYDGFASAHNKIIVRFKPATGGSGKFSYLAHIDGNFSTPHASLLGEKATVDDGGLINMEITNLEYNTSYLVTIYVQDIVTQKIVISNKSITVWTMEDFVPEFKGVSKIENVAGVEGMTSLRVKWNTAGIPTIAGDDAFNPIHTPSGYNVYYSTLKSELEAVLALEEQHSPVLTNYPHTKIVNVPSASTAEKVITSLTVGKEYFVAVRARQSSIPPIYERNIKIISSETYSETPVVFNGIKTASTPKDIKGFSQINIAWDSCIGCSEYRVYVKPLNDDNGAIHPISDASYLISTITDFNINSKTLVSGSLITANQNYKVYMIACKDALCGWNGSSFDELEIQGRFTSISVTTTPPIAPFSESQPDDMIASLVQPSGINGLKQLRITWAEMDTTQGFYSKVRIYRVVNKNGDITNITGNANMVLVGTNAAVPFGTPYLDPSSPSLEATNDPTEALITNLSRDTEYCFTVLPWITGNGLTAAQEVTLLPTYRPTVKCSQTSYMAPDFGSTSMFPVCTPQTGGTNALIEWTPPETMNIFTHYEVYFRKTDGAFSFDGADGAWLNGDGKYFQDAEKPKVDYLLNSLTVQRLIPNTEYYFGVNTYYLPQGEVTPLRQYPIGQATTSCQTLNANVLHGGWKHVQAIGPKIDGRNLTVVPEKIREDKNRVATPDLVSGATHGIVRLQWHDFEIPGTNLRVKDYDENGNTGIGYHVYRFTVTNDTEKTEMLDPTHPNWSHPDFTTQLKFNIVSNADGKFAYSSTAINADPASSYLIPASNAQIILGDNIYEFVDYPPSEKTIYYYKVVAVFNNTEAAFEDPTNPTNVIMVIVPDNNEAFIHRWIANLSLCEKMGRGLWSSCTDLLGRCSDMENSYRCEYDGIGGVLDGATKYADLGKHLVMDRFELGINYTKGKCTIAGVHNQDCIGPVNYLDLSHSPGFEADMVVSVGRGLPRPHIKLWSADTWKLPTYTAGLLTAGVPGTGIGKDIMTNNAYMPPINYTGTLAIHQSCQSRLKTEFYPGDGLSSFRRVIRRKDFIIAGQWEDNLTSAEKQAISTATNVNANTSYKDCNSSGQTWSGDPDFEAGFTANMYCTSGVATEGCIFHTGSDGAYSSENCQSRFGVQDLVGNLAELSSDMLDKTTLIGKVSTIDPTNSDFTEIRFDGNTMAATVSNIVIRQNATYVNQLYYLPLTCTGPSGYSADTSQIGYHQCGPDDFLPKNLNVLLASQFQSAVAASAPFAKDKIGIYGSYYYATGEHAGVLTADYDFTSALYGSRCVYEISD